jgi:hypothetical protein
MAEIVLTHKFQKVTLSGTSEHTLNFDSVLANTSTKPYEVFNGIASIELASGASVQVSPNAAIDANSGLVTTDNPKAILDIRVGHAIRVKGGAGSEVIYVSILSD